MEFSKDKVFFDEFHQDKLTKLSANEVLDKIYTQECEYVILFMSKNYQRNHWTGKVEWKAIKNKLIPNRKNAIIPVLYDEEAKVDGIDLRKDITIKIPQTSPKTHLKPQDVADKIIAIIKTNDLHIFNG
ncbi:TIR domain-containing protein [Viscerimonas tarda]